MFRVLLWVCYEPWTMSHGVENRDFRLSSIRLIVWHDLSLCVFVWDTTYSFVNHKIKTSIEVICEWIGISDGNICFLSFSIKSIFSFSFALRILQKCALCNTHWNADLDYNAWSLRLLTRRADFCVWSFWGRPKICWDLAVHLQTHHGQWWMKNVCLFWRIFVHEHITHHQYAMKTKQKKVRVTPSWRITSFMYNTISKKIKERPKNQIKLFKTPWII